MRVVCGITVGLASVPTCFAFALWIISCSFLYSSLFNIIVLHNSRVNKCYRNNNNNNNGGVEFCVAFINNKRK